MLKAVTNFERIRLQFECQVAKQFQNVSNSLNDLAEINLSRNKIKPRQKDDKLECDSIDYCVLKLLPLPPDVDLLLVNSSTVSILTLFVCPVGRKSRFSRRTDLYLCAATATKYFPMI